MMWNGVKTTSLGHLLKSNPKNQQLHIYTKHLYLLNIIKPFPIPLFNAPDRCDVDPSVKQDGWSWVWGYILYIMCGMCGFKYVWYIPQRLGWAPIEKKWLNSSFQFLSSEDCLVLFGSVIPLKALVEIFTKC